MEKLRSIELVKNERLRQIKEEGYSWRHDDQETTHQLVDAAIVYTTPAPLRYEIMHKWPRDEKFFKSDKTYTYDGRIWGQSPHISFLTDFICYTTAYSKILYVSLAATRI